MIHQEMVYVNDELNSEKEEDKNRNTEKMRWEGLPKVVYELEDTPACGNKKDLRMTYPKLSK